MFGSREPVTGLPDGFAELKLSPTEAAEVVESMKPAIAQMEACARDDDETSMRYNSTKKGVTIHIGTQVRGGLRGGVAGMRKGWLRRHACRGVPRIARGDPSKAHAAPHLLRWGQRGGQYASPDPVACDAQMCRRGPAS